MFTERTVIFTNESDRDRRRNLSGGCAIKITETDQRGTTEIMYRILLVDDEILVRDAIRENIDWKAMDCELVGDCDNGKAAAEFVQNHPVDIVLTDILMPYMDGMELSRFLHDNYPDIVIVIFSGFGEFEYAKKAIQYGVSEYMLKPVTAMELRNVIGKMKEKVDQQRKREAGTSDTDFRELSEKRYCDPFQSAAGLCG